MKKKERIKLMSHKHSVYIHIPANATLAGKIDEAADIANKKVKRKAIVSLLILEVTISRLIIPSDARFY